MNLAQQVKASLILRGHLYEIAKKLTNSNPLLLPVGVFQELHPYLLASIFSHLPHTAPALFLKCRSGHVTLCLKSYQWLPIASSRRF